MTYENPGCAFCPSTVRTCCRGESEARGPGFCPSKVDEESIERAWRRYEDPEVRRIARASALVESEGYCKWTRVEEICQLAKRLGFTKIGIATCIVFGDVGYFLYFSFRGEQVGE